MGAAIDMIGRRYGKLTSSAVRKTETTFDTGAAIVTVARRYLPREARSERAAKRAAAVIGAQTRRKRGNDTAR